MKCAATGSYSVCTLKCC